MPPGDPKRLKEIYEKTEICRSPITGIVAGYHDLPFTLVGPNDEEQEGDDPAAGSLKLSGKISVSPKMVIPIHGGDERFSEIFPESEPFMDRSLISRVFSFSAAYRRHHRIRNEFLQVEALAEEPRHLLSQVMNEMAKAEIINMGVIWCPSPRHYPVSLERFIVSVLDREFK